MRILKSKVLNNECKLRPGDFLRKLRGGLEGRINAFKFGLEPITAISKRFLREQRIFVHLKNYISRRDLAKAKKEKRKNARL